MLRRFRSLLRPLVPRRVLDARRRRAWERDQNALKDRPLDQVFGEIYASRLWGAPPEGMAYWSGHGSSQDSARGYEDFVVAHVLDHGGVARIVDIGCGDFQVSGRILQRLEAAGRSISYVGCDIAANVVDYNEATHGRPGVTFARLDISRESPPAGDLVCVREVFQHLSNDRILAAIANLRTVFERGIITETVFADPDSPNVDIESGYMSRDFRRSGIFPDLPPFDLDVEREMREPRPNGQIFRTLLVRF